MAARNATTATFRRSLHVLLTMSPDHGDDFDQILGPLLRPGYQLAVAMLGDRGLAEDAVLEAAATAWRWPARPLHSPAAEVWFLAIVANRCRSVGRGSWLSVLRRAGAWGRPPGEHDDRPAETLDLDHLDTWERLALYLHIFHDLTFEEVAQIMGSSVSAARSQVQRATRRLRPGVDLREVFEDA